ncbi:hypothetical protein Ocin01_18294 [Orchesella cincta]|uniref:Secreted protein n=1 Tax=Orchesella cincta TaxID=48709 RepID=A0A1D2M5Y8_ORCCI|nr:hypothetical protein Ocin01_18294 [Orchesella cincta]
MLLKLLPILVLLGVVAMSNGDADSCVGIFTGEVNCLADKGKFVYFEGENEACLPIVSFKSDTGEPSVPCMGQKKFDTEKECHDTCFKK